VLQQVHCHELRRRIPRPARDFARRQSLRYMYMLCLGLNPWPHHSFISSMLPAGSDLHILLRGLLDPEALFLLREAAVEARRLYADLIDPAAPLPTKDPPRPGSIYLIAFSAKNLVGCGALRKIDATTGGNRPSLSR
jgi:hypothetical protein